MTRRFSSAMPARLLAIHLAALLLSAGASAATWEGPGCASTTELAELVDAALELAPYGQGRGSSAPGFSVAVQHDDCGRFAYAAGRRQVEDDLPNEISTRHHIGSMTKPVTAALTLILAERGDLGPRGLEARVAGFFTRRERKLLRKGNVPGGRLCPATIQALDRGSEGNGFVTVRAPCPALKKITVRHLLNGNHGLWDFVNEVDRNGNGFADVADYLLRDLFAALGIDVPPPPRPIGDGFDVLAETGLLANRDARRGGRALTDFEASFGNSGYQLLGAILERAGGETYDALVAKHITGPLGLDDMGLVVEAPRASGQVAGEYAVTTAADLSGLDDGLDESLLGIYPLVDINGHPAVSISDLGPFAFSNGGGGAGAIAASPDSYVRFFHALVTGGLLSDAAQRQLEEGFLPIEGAGFEHGFALFRSAAPGFGTLINKGGTTAGSDCLAVHSLAAEGGNGVTAVACRNSVALFLPNPEAGLPAAAGDVDSLALELLERSRP